MWSEIAAVFLGLSLLCYGLFAGADFGAGMIEAFVTREDRASEETVITQALGPVWEANHVWLILAVVILFMGFPRVYAEMSVTYHLPLTLLLLGIILRGCAFTFRHYDAVRDRSRIVYTSIFIVSSFIAPLMLGVVAGSILKVIAMSRAAAAFSGDSGILAPSGDFLERFVWPWANLFSFAVGVFTCALFSFLAAVYLIGETELDLRARFFHRARIASVVAVVAGGLVFVCGEIDHVPLLQLFLDSRLSLLAMALATAFLIPLWQCLKHGHPYYARVFAAGQVAFVLLGWFGLQYPVFIRADSGSITISNAGAGEATLRVLVGALIVGSFLIFPALIYLLRIFKAKRN